MTIHPKPKPAKKPKVKRITAPKRRKLLETELEALMRELVWWRDGGECVLKSMDGGRCGGPIQWGHLIARQKSPYLKFALGNSFCQCKTHNGLEHWGDPIFGIWYDKTFGVAAREALWEARNAHINRLPPEWELEEWIAEVKDLLDDRPATYTRDLLVERGYFGRWPREKG